MVHDSAGVSERSSDKDAGRPSGAIAIGFTAWALVNHAGILFQKDLGLDTAKLAERMSSFNPDRTWQKVSDTAPVQ